VSFRTVTLFSVAPVVVRPTVLADRPAVVELVRRAFTHGTRNGHEEVDIVERTWTLEPGDDVIDLVAEREGEIIGHVLAAPGTLGTTPLLAVAPLAVAPAHQRHGIGSGLMVELIQRAEDAAWPAVVLLGNPKYYERFGFEPAGRTGVVYLPVGPESPYFQIRQLTRYTQSLHGSFAYWWEAAASKAGNGCGKSSRGCARSRSRQDRLLGRSCAHD
jgi:putative acetyltransferase